jgi:2-polyprenyl-3-methyl-5-hydroxy-6-metoxy-1,4-benzoquinol methylase
MLNVSTHRSVGIPATSTWFEWHIDLIRPGSRALDLACGSGRHAIAAAARGAHVVAADRDSEAIAAGREAGKERHAKIEWNVTDLEGEWPAWGDFDVVMVFNYLDRERMPRIREAVRPGGILLMETFLTTQREEGWGPTSDAHLLLPGELARLVAPFEILHGREVAEPVDDGSWRLIASVVARRRT